MSTGHIGATRIAEIRTRRLEDGLIEDEEQQASVMPHDMDRRPAFFGADG
jgi:hypothetical protein